MLNPQDIDHLTAQGESLTVEFKGESRRQLSDAELVENVVCLTNTEGGWLFVGVEDDGRITGACPRHQGGLTDPLRLEALISNSTRPAVSTQVQVVDHPEGPVLAVQVPRSPVVIATSRGRYVRRMIGGRGTPECVAFFVYEMGDAVRGIGGQDHSLTPVPGARWEDLDALEFERLRRYIRESGGRGDDSLLELSNLEVAKALGAVEGNSSVKAVRLLGLLLFGNQAALQRFVPSHEVAFQELAGTEVGVNDFLRWPLLRSFEEITARLRHRNHSREVFAGMVRIDVPDYSERALREALANALIHRDYRALGAVHVQWHGDSVRVDSPGGFPPGVRLDNLLVTQPRPRNPMLADAFKRIGLVERTGRGIDILYKGQLRFGRDAPRFDLSGSDSVSVVLPGGPADLDWTRWVVEEERRGAGLDVSSLLILQALYRGQALGLPEVGALLHQDEATALRVLQALSARGLVEEVEAAFRMSEERRPRASKKS